MTEVAAPSEGRLSKGLIVLMAFACGAMAANLYYAQTLISEIGPEIGLSKELAGVVVTLTQLGYGIGLFLLVPLVDLFEKPATRLVQDRRHFPSTLAIAVSRGPIPFLARFHYRRLRDSCANSSPARFPLQLRPSARSHHWSDHDRL